MPKFYRTRVTIDVLSEEPLGDCLSLSQVDYAISEGDCVGTGLKMEATELTPKEMADALYEAGSEPGFFQLDDDGNTVEERLAADSEQYARDAGYTVNKRGDGYVFNDPDGNDDDRPPFATEAEAWDAAFLDSASYPGPEDQN